MSTLRVFVLLNYLHATDISALRASEIIIIMKHFNYGKTCCYNYYLIRCWYPLCFPLCLPLCLPLCFPLCLSCLMPFLHEVRPHERHSADISASLFHPLLLSFVISFVLPFESFVLNALFLHEVRPHERHSTDISALLALEFRQVFHSVIYLRSAVILMS